MKLIHVIWYNSQTGHSFLVIILCYYNVQHYMLHTHTLFNTFRTKHDPSLYPGRRPRIPGQDQDVLQTWVAVLTNAFSRLCGTCSGKHLHHKKCESGWVELLCFVSENTAGFQGDYRLLFAHRFKERFSFKKKKKKKIVLLNYTQTHTHYTLVF